MRRVNFNRNSTPLSKRGFSLIELMIVLTILMLIAGYSVPKYLEAVARANEASAASSVRIIIGAQNMYRNTVGVFTDLPGLGSEYLDDQSLITGLKSGYFFDSTPGSSPSLQFTVGAIPRLRAGASRTGQRTYYADQTAVIRFSLTGDADSASSPLQD